MLSNLISKKCDFKYRRWSDNRSVASRLWNAFGGRFVVVIFDPRYIDDNYYSEAVEYYNSTYEYDEKIGGLDFQIKPNVEVLELHNLFPESQSFSPISMLRVEDLQSLEAILTFTTGDELMHFFSDDYSLLELKYMFFNYGKECFLEDDGSLVDYLIDRYGDLMSERKLCFIDTYADDEDSESFCQISSH